MSNDITNFDNFGTVADVFKESPIDPSTFTAGIGMSWPILTIRGKEFGWRYRGNEHTYTAPNPNAGGSIMPVQFLDVVLVAAGTRISKVYYADGYKKGDRKPPTCWSADGNTPDDAVPDEVKKAITNFKCRACQRNVIGSKIGDAGQRLKECSDNKRLAIVTMSDLKNTDFGGPFMLRLPPGSFQNYTAYCGAMAARGFQPFQIITRLTFDGAEYPKLAFYPVRALTKDEAGAIVDHHKNPRVSEMLNDKAVAAFLDPDVADLEIEAEVTLVPSAGSAAPPAANDWAPTPPKASVPPEVTSAVTPPSKPVLTPAQQKIADLEAQLAAAQKEEESEPEPEPLTPEQLKIRELEARLAEAEANKPKRGRPRAKPVGPPESTVTATGNGAAAPEAPSAVGNDISNRVAGIVAGKTQAS